MPKLEIGTILEIAIGVLLAGLLLSFVHGWVSAQGDSIMGVTK